MFKSKSIRLSFIAVVLIIIGLYEVQSMPQTIVYKPVPTSTSKVKKSVGETPIFNKSTHSNNDPLSIWVVVNKVRPLTPLAFAPTDLVTPNVSLRSPGSEASKVSFVLDKPLEDLFAAAKADGINLMLTSGYRSYAYQTNVYNGYLSTLGQTETDKVSARPGYSEHQTGLAADIEPTSHKCELDACFATTPEGIWLATNAYKYGFIIRYPSDKTAITGYSFEPWHIRYVGILLSTEMHNQDITTLEEFFNLHGGNTYL